MKWKTFICWSGVLALILSAAFGIFALRHKTIFLSFEDFNQKGSGWRALYDERGDCREAARLNEDYLRFHRFWLTPDQIAIVHFHAAQFFAALGMISQAMPHLAQATNRFMREDWNDMVVATQAFLLHDREQLEAARHRLVAAHAADDSIEEANILIEHFGESYARMRWWAPLAPVVAIPSSALPELRIAAEELAKAFGLSVVTAETNPEHCIWLELHPWNPNTGSWRGTFNYWDGYMILHYDSGTVISASSPKWLDPAVTRFIRSSREHNGKRGVPTGLMTNFPLAR